MKRLLIGLIVVAALAAAAYWAYPRLMRASPDEAYRQMVVAAQLGDREGFLAGFTADSAALMAAFLALADAYSLVDDKPYRQLVLGEITYVQVDPEDDEVATVGVEWRDREVDVPMRLEDGRWKVDARKLDLALRGELADR